MHFNSNRLHAGNGANLNGYQRKYHRNKYWYNFIFYLCLLFKLESFAAKALFKRWLK